MTVQDSKLVGSLEGGRGSPLQLRGEFPVSLSFLMYKEHLLVDPTADEEKHLAESVLTITQTARGDILAVSKPGGVPVSRSKLKRCFSLASTHAKQRHAIIAASK